MQWKENGPLVMVAVLSACRPVKSERNVMESSVRWFGRVILKLMAQSYWIETAEGNCNKSSHGHRLAKILMTLLWELNSCIRGLVVAATS